MVCKVPAQLEFNHMTNVTKPEVCHTVLPSLSETDHMKPDALSKASNHDKAKLNILVQEVEVQLAEDTESPQDKMVHTVVASLPKMDHTV